MKNSSKKSDVPSKSKPAKPKLSWATRGTVGALAILGGVTYFLGFAGFDIWPLAFVGFVPMLLAFARHDHELSEKQVFAFGWLFGLAADIGGFYWLMRMLLDFSGFPWLACLFFMVVLCAYSGAARGLALWLAWRGRRRGWPLWLTLPLAVGCLEQFYVQLFDNYLANSFHNVPVLIQISDLGGPVLLSMIATLTNVALFELLIWLRNRTQPFPRVSLGSTVVLLTATIVYGLVRIGATDALSKASPEFDVGVVQTNMGLFQKREDPMEGHRRHLEQTAMLEQNGPLDLVVWPESAFTFFQREDLHNVDRLVRARQVKSPLLYGGLALRGDDLENPSFFNTAFLTDSSGNIIGSYDKTYLLAFGEYLPLGSVFPVLYDISPNSGRFTPGNHVKPLEIGNFRISTLICYEDILPAFVRRAVREGSPHLLVNVTNDAWFGDTTEPWIHLALAKFRAVEHHRWLIRATNSGVSAVVDPVGRVVKHTGVFTRENLHQKVRMMQTTTVYEMLGDWPGWLAMLGTLVLAFWRRRTGSE